MRNLFVLFIIFIIGNSSLGDVPFVSGSFYKEYNGEYYDLNVLGLLTTKKIGTYIKAAELNCYYSKKTCTLLTANYVLNGKLRPSLYPSLTEFKILEIITSDKKLLTITAQEKNDSCTMKIDIEKETVTIVNNYTKDVFFLISDLNKIEEELNRIKQNSI